MMKYIYVISALTENTLRVLQRIVGTFTRHRLNIEQLNVFETNNKGTSYFNIIIHSDEKTVEKLIKQLQRIIELFEVNITNRIPIIEQKQPEPTTTNQLKEHIL